MNGTTTIDTFAMRLSPPMTTSATQAVTTAPEIITAGDWTVPSTVTAISEDAFMNCTYLRSMVISSPALSVGNSAFSGCSSLVTVFFTGSEAEWESILLTVDNGGNGNDIFKNTKVYYYSESEPAVSGDFWYYNDKNEPRCW